MTMAHLEVSSPDLVGGEVPVEFTCDGANAAPRLSWSKGPEGTRSFALVVDDPDAPHPPFVHWLVWNIGLDQRQLNASNVGRFAQGVNGFGRVGWGGPCPPHGHQAHRYVFRVYALDRELDLQPSTKREALLQAMRGHVLAQGELIATYQRRPRQDLGETPTHP